MAGEDKLNIALANNKTWAQRCASEKPDLFPTLAKGQHPEILWIGCSDSRCPETTILGLDPGDVFTHRNIANIIHPGDLNAGAVIEYAVAAIKVKHIVVCGHTSCGGVNAALGNNRIGLIDAWLLPLRSLRKQHMRELEKLSPHEQVAKLVEYNVLAGVSTLKENPNVISAMQERRLQVHGMVYDISCGDLKVLKSEEDEADGLARLTAFETK